ncbi:putative cyclase [Aeromicrobium marinum DSM 15272]|uniref:Cyclase n=1 Tax=Aeromicrobium marinum DSM 15272 TaxID=585531 RepID=E2SCJ9_9ACTN|nr:cyclase family protein [Aeromicrobium marinum]EFQ82952.1 putative cyclase [Aeromicrobium marinum DSM 15272]
MTTSPPSGPTPLWDLQRRLLEDCEYTDLTHAFHPGQPHFPAFPDEERAQIFDAAAGDGFSVHQYRIVGQWGTHVDPPSHFVAGARTLDEIPVTQMMLPLVVLDISGRVRDDPDTVPTMVDVRAWESRNGPVPAKSFVALRTDWSRRWPDAEAMANLDDAGDSHAPGWSREVLEYLVETADVSAVGHEGTDTDPGSATSEGDYGLELYLLQHDRWQIELMTHLDRVPEAGALVVATWPKPLGGSGFPARVFALHQRGD